VIHVTSGTTQTVKVCHLMYINIWTHLTYPGTAYNVVCQTFHYPYITYPHLKPEIDEILTSVKPDIIIGTETSLNNTISSY
jgi:hypothetical protein